MALAPLPYPPVECATDPRGSRAVDRTEPVGHTDLIGALGCGELTMFLKGKTAVVTGSTSGIGLA
jgi:hypothetical protein